MEVWFIATGYVSEIKTHSCFSVDVIASMGVVYFVTIFTSRSARSARTAGTKIALRFPRLFVCLFVCLFVRPHLSRAQYITSYVTMQLQCIAAFGDLRTKLQQMKVVLCCLDGEHVVGSRKDPVLVTYSYELEAHDETAELALPLWLYGCTALGIYYLWLYSCSLIAWPKLSCVYCTGKVSGWFFRHEMSDLL